MRGMVQVNCAAVCFNNTNLVHLHPEIARYLSVAEKVVLKYNGMVYKVVSK